MKTHIKLVIMVFSIYFLFSITHSLAIDTNQSICESGEGTWITPKLATTDDPEVTKKELTPYCNCEKGFFWNDTTKACEDDSQLRCIQTLGTWINNSCQCPEGTIKWTVGFGCDTLGPIPKSEIEEIAKNSNNLQIYFLIGLAILFTVGLIVYLKKSGKREKK